MSETENEQHHVNEALRKERKRFRLRVLLSSLLLVVVAVVLGVWLILLNSVEIDIRPAEAKKSAVVDIAGGLAYSTEHIVYTLSSRTDITIAATGFVSKNISLTDDNQKVIAVTLEPIKPIINARTNVALNGIEWRLNGKLISYQNALNITVDAGKYTLEASHDYYHSVAKEITTKLGKTYDLSLVLPPITGTISINSSPSNQRVILAGKTAGKTPLNVTVNGGSYGVQIISDDYDTIEDTLTVTTDNRDVSRHYRLQLKKAQLSFSLTPTNGTLLIDGKLISADNTTINARQNTLIIYKKEGFFSHSQQINLQPGETKHLTINLEQELGLVEIKSQPEAVITIDNQRIGTTPMTLSLPAKRHSVRLDADEYRSYQTDIIPSSAQPKTIDIKLDTEYQAKLKERGKTFAQTLAIDLLPVKPNAFTMGSPDNEKGRRRNEFLRSIELTKAFFIGTTEITNKQYRAFNSSHQGDDNLPAVNISWNEAAQFCNWLSQQEGLKPFYIFSGQSYQGYHSDSTGYRLPTEAEWEWLARKAGRAVQTRFVWGSQINVPKKVGNFADESAKGKVKRYIPNYNDGYVSIAPVGKFKTNPFTLHDLAGNVSEWVNDFYSNTPPDTRKIAIDPMGAERGMGHVVKGANWKSGTLTELRASYRQLGTKKSDTIGFRIARWKQ